MFDTIQTAKFVKYNQEMMVINSSIHYIKSDLRVTKTYQILLKALNHLLELRNFRKLTVHDICVEAQVSRATFYAHFRDKYDLLDYWLKTLSDEPINPQIPYEQIENKINSFFQSHQRIVRHILMDADSETNLILFDFILSLLNLSSKDDIEFNPEYIVLTNMCAGGVLSYLHWQLKSKFPVQLPVMNLYFYKFLKIFME